MAAFALASAKGYFVCAQTSAKTGRMYFRNCAGFSLIGKWPTSFMTVTLAPGISLAVRSVSAGSQEWSYSPVSR